MTVLDRVPSILPLAATCLLSVACDGNNLVWVEFSRPAEVRLYVEPEADCVERDAASTAELRSNVVSGVVGEVRITPACGPVGTLHEMLVTVEEDWEDVVGRATATVAPRGDDQPDPEQVFELRRDSAFPGQYGLEIRSLGLENEVRVDVFEFLLLQSEELQDGVVPQTDE